MLVTQITTHVQDALARLAQQYQGKPGIAGFYTALIQQVQDLENAIYPIDTDRQIWDGSSTPAQGAQLDGIGQIVGQPRNGLDDMEYTLFIFGKIASNFSDGTIPTILTVVGYVFQAQSVILQESFPAGISVQVLGSPIPPSLYPTAVSLIKNSLGAGIRLVFTGASPSVNIFRFAGPGVNGAINGFGSLTDPTVGGVFIGLI